MVLVFVYSSLSGAWAAGTASSWNALGLNQILRSGHWLPSYAYGCFYWQVPHRNKLLKLNISRMEFSAVGLPPNYEARHAVVVEAGEGRVGIFSCAYDPNMPTPLQYYIWQNEGENAIENLEDEKTISLPIDCQRYDIVGVAQGSIFLLGGPSHGRKSGIFSLEIKTLKVERLCSPIGHGWGLAYSGYFGYPRYLSPRRI